MERRTVDISACALHILAMALMLLDHMWATLPNAGDWMTDLGRLAFPIFAFMIVEGYFHTRSVKKYMQRLLLFALLSEIPFNLLYAYTVFYPFQQNVLWTFLIALVCICAMEKAKQKGKWWLTALASVLAVALGFAAGFLAMTDYFGVGVVTVLVFYFFRRRRWWCLAGQIAALYYLNVVVLGGQYYPVTLFDHEFELYRQGLALFALLPIWLYRGRQGYHSKWFQYACYAFYPVHMLLLVALA